MSHTKYTLTPELIDEDEDSEVAYYVTPYTQEERLALQNDIYYAIFMAREDRLSRAVRDEEIV